MVYSFIKQAVKKDAKIWRSRQTDFKVAIDRSVGKTRNAKTGLATEHRAFLAARKLEILYILVGGQGGKNQVILRIALRCCKNIETVRLTLWKFEEAMNGLEKNRYNVLIRRFSPRNWQCFFHRCGGKSPNKWN